MLNKNACENISWVIFDDMDKNFKISDLKYENLFRVFWSYFRWFAILRNFERSQEQGPTRKINRDPNPNPWFFIIQEKTIPAQIPYLKKNLQNFYLLKISGV